MDAELRRKLEGQSTVIPNEGLKHDKTEAALLALFGQSTAILSEGLNLLAEGIPPSRIHFVSALPKTRNAKVMCRVIRSAYLGEDPGDLSALENTASVEEIQQIKKQI